MENGREKGKNGGKKREEKEEKTGRKREKRGGGKREVLGVGFGAGRRIGTPDDYRAASDRRPGNARFKGQDS